MPGINTAIGRLERHTPHTPVWALYGVISLRRDVYKTAQWGVSTAHAPLMVTALLQMILILNKCTTFVPRFNNWGLLASLTETTSEPTERSRLPKNRDLKTRIILMRRRRRIRRSSRIRPSVIASDVSIEVMESENASEPLDGLHRTHRTYTLYAPIVHTVRTAHTAHTVRTVRGSTCIV